MPESLNTASEVDHAPNIVVVVQIGKMSVVLGLIQVGSERWIAFFQVYLIQ